MMRTLVLSLVLACAGAQLAPGSALLASLLTHGSQLGDHSHAVALVTDHGHHDLVLSHVESGGRALGDAPEHEHRPAGPSGTDHVIHITGDDASNPPPRRAANGAVATLAVAVAVLPAPVPVWAPRPSPEARAHGSDPLRTVVLRL